MIDVKINKQVKISLILTDGKSDLFLSGDRAKFVYAMIMSEKPVNESNFVNKTPNAIRVMIASIRKQIKENFDCDIIENITGKGYCINVNSIDIESKEVF